MFPLACLTIAGALVAACGIEAGGPDDSAVLDWMVTDGLKRADAQNVEIATSSETGRGSFRLTLEGEAILRDDVMERLNPFVWARLCGIDDPENYDLPAHIPVYTLRAEAGAVPFVGRATAFEENGEWDFTAYSFSLRDSEDNVISGTGLPFIEADAVVIGTSEFDALCDEARQS